MLRIGEHNSREHYLLINSMLALPPVHSLDADPIRRQQMYIYLKLVQNGVEFDAAFEQALAIEYDDMDSACRPLCAPQYAATKTACIGGKQGDIPRMTKTNIDISERAAMSVIYSKLSLFDNAFLGKGLRQRMERDFEHHFLGLLEP